MLSERAIRELIDPILQRSLVGSGLLEFTVKAAEDHDGDAALFVDAFFEGKGRPVDAKALLAAIGEMRDVLAAQGDHRFPYLIHHIPDPDQSAAA